MSIGNLREKVTIQRLTAGQDAAGQPLTTWTNLIATGDGKVSADVRYLNGLETIKADAQAAVAKASIRIRRRTDVTAAMRVVHGTTTLEIKAVLPTADRRWLDLACEAPA